MTSKKERSRSDPAKTLPAFPPASHRRVFLNTEREMDYQHWRLSVLRFGVVADEQRLVELYDRDFEPQEAAYTIEEEITL